MNEEIKGCGGLSMEESKETGAEKDPKDSSAIFSTQRSNLICSVPYLRSKSRGIK